MDDNRLNKALKLLKLSPDEFGLLTEREVEDAAEDQIAIINRRMQTLKSTKHSFDTDDALHKQDDAPHKQDDALHKQIGIRIKVRKAADYVLRCLRTTPVSAVAGKVPDAVQDSGLDRNHAPPRLVPRKAQTAVSETPEIPFLGLSDNEAEYARRYYQNGIHVLRRPEFMNSLTDRLVNFEKELASLELEHLTKLGLDEVLGQVGWPFPESCDTQRAFRGAKPVIELIRAVVGEPKTAIDPIRRLLIEASCLYADDSACNSPSQVNIPDLQNYVGQRADGRFEHWDHLQIVLCYFLAVDRPAARSSDASRSVMLQFLQRATCEIERKVAALTQNVRLRPLRKAHKHTLRVTLSPADLLNELSGRFTIADLVSSPTAVPPESIPYIKRQFDILSDSPRLTHSFAERQARSRGTGASTGKLPKRSCLERNLIHHRIASWLDPQCRPQTWSAVLPKNASSPDKSNIVGTQRPDFLPLGDYLSLALGFPTTGWRDSDHKPSQPRTSLAQRFAAQKHIDDLIAGLLSGAFSPRLCRAAVACCSKCRTPLLDMRCTGKAAKHHDCAAGSEEAAAPCAADCAETAAHCDKAGLEAREFCTVDMLIMPDIASGCFLDTVPATMNQTERSQLQFCIADESSNRRNFTSVWFYTSSPEISSQYINLDSADGVEHQLQAELSREFPEIQQKLELSSVGVTTLPDYTWASAFRHLHGLPFPGCTASPPRSFGWLRADLADYSSWPPKTPTLDHLQTGLRKSFWSAVRDLFSHQPHLIAILALNPTVQDRIITLKYLGLYPKNSEWSDSYTRIVNSVVLLKPFGIHPSGEVAADDAVVMWVASSLRDWFVPAIAYPWLAFCRMSQDTIHTLPWKDRHEISAWWAALPQQARNERLAVVSKVPNSGDFKAEVHSRLLLTEPEDFTDLLPQQQQTLDSLARQFWTLAFFELRQQLWEQMNSTSPAYQPFFT